MLKNRSALTWVIAFCMATVFALINSFLGRISISNANLPHRLFVLLGSDFLEGGYIQYLTYVAFLCSLLKILEQMQSIKDERKELGKNLLPNNERHLFLPSDVQEVHFKMIDLEKKQKGNLLVGLIKKCCQKFRSSHNISEVLELINIQTEINRDKAEGHQSTIRYLIWVIPSIGFIGTVLGISKSLLIANTGDMELITSSLGLAFDTTLVGLVLSVIVMFYYHKLQEQTDCLHADLKEYVIENLVNKIEVVTK